MQDENAGRATALIKGVSYGSIIGAVFGALATGAHILASPPGGGLTGAWIFLTAAGVVFGGAAGLGIAFIATDQRR